MHRPGTGRVTVRPHGTPRTTEPTISERTDTATPAGDVTDAALATTKPHDDDGTAAFDARGDAVAAATLPAYPGDRPLADLADDGAGPAEDRPGQRLARPLRATWRRARLVPTVVLVITALHLALLATYSVVYPTWTGYDEAQHVDMVYGLLHGDGWPAPGQKMISQGVAATSDDFDRGAYADMFQSGGKKRRSPSFAEITPTPRADRGSFDALGGPAPVTDGRLSNQMVQHPPMVYAVGAAVLGALPATNWAYDEQVYVLRLLNILLVAPLPLLAWATARRLRLSEAVARGAAVLPLAVPGFDRVGATFNNDGVLILTTGVLTFVLAGVLRGDRRMRTAVWAGVWLALTFLSKGLALLLPLMVVAAYLVGWWNTRSAQAADVEARPGRRVRALVGSLPWWPAIAAIAIGLGLGGWWWVRNYVLYGAVQPNGWDADPPRRESLLLPDSFWTWLWYFIRTMISRFWGGLGMFEPPQLTPVAIVTATVVVGIVAVTCLVSGLGQAARRAVAIPAQPDGGRAQDQDEQAQDEQDQDEQAQDGAIRSGTDRPTGRRLLDRRAWRDRLARAATPAVLLLPVALAYVTVAQRSWAEYELYTRGIAVQGRYLYLGLVGAGVVIAAGLARLLGRRDRWTPVVMLVGALLMQAFALLAICSYYWLGRGVRFSPARVPSVAAAIARWAPFPSGVTFAILALTAALALVTLACVARSVLRDRPSSPPPTAGGGRRTSPPSSGATGPHPDRAPLAA
ncbi:glycosyltransferase family 39 protein [Pseudofrankia sp. DC12]|uniref:glycosyltransferase family 39 protein n=1 Tax=Pseudofrankia sp. DC12 TaxID=683315 RepID=UPI000B05F8E4|nr:glycosyltransferase family 39 protein [Pseudofrankia sp. DC12]